MKKLYRSKKNKMISGFLGGLGEFIGIDPTILRLIYVLLCLLTGFLPLLIFYLIAVAIVPAENGKPPKVEN